jgi:hypothetical protein
MIVRVDDESIDEIAGMNNEARSRSASLRRHPSAALLRNHDLIDLDNGLDVGVILDVANNLVAARHHPVSEVLDLLEVKQADRFVGHGLVGEGVGNALVDLNFAQAGLVEDLSNEWDVLGQVVIHVKMAVAGLGVQDLNAKHNLSSGCVVDGMCCGLQYLMLLH